MALRSLIFDLDNTLYDATSSYTQALRGLIPPEAYAQARLAVKARLPQGHVCARNRLLYFKEWLEGQGRYSPAAVLALMDSYEKQLAEAVQNCWRQRGYEPLLRRLAARFLLIVLTNENSRTQLIKMRAIDPGGEIFPHLITSEELGLEKPSAAAFQHVLSRFGLQPPETMMVGDSWDGDIQPAQQAGMRFCWTREFSPSGSAPKDCPSIADLHELEPLLA